MKNKTTLWGWGNDRPERGDTYNPARVQLCTDRQRRACEKAKECIRLRPSSDDAKERMAGVKPLRLLFMPWGEKKDKLLMKMDKKIREVLNHCLKRCQRRRLSVTAWPNRKG